MRSVNKVILIWNVVRDPDAKDTTSGHAFTSFVIATNREWYNANWDNQSLAEFHKVVAWWKLAELCAKFLKKGKFIYIEGYLKTRSWEQDWKKMYRTEVVAQDMIMLNKKSDIEFSEEDMMAFNEQQFSDDMMMNWESNSNSWEVKKEDKSSEDAPAEESKEEKPKQENKSSWLGLDWDEI